MRNPVPLPPNAKCQCILLDCSGPTRFFATASALKSHLQERHRPLRALPRVALETQGIWCCLHCGAPSCSQAARDKHAASVHGAPGPATTAAAAPPGRTHGSFDSYRRHSAPEPIEHASRVVSSNLAFASSLDLESYSLHHPGGRTLPRLPSAFAIAHESILRPILSAAVKRPSDTAPDSLLLIYPRACLYPPPSSSRVRDFTRVLRARCTEFANGGAERLFNVYDWCASHADDDAHGDDLQKTAAHKLPSLIERDVKDGRVSHALSRLNSPPYLPPTPAGAILLSTKIPQHADDRLSAFADHIRTKFPTDDLPSCWIRDARELDEITKHWEKALLDSNLDAMPDGTGFRMRYLVVSPTLRPIVGMYMRRLSLYKTSAAFRRFLSIVSVNGAAKRDAVTGEFPTSMDKVKPRPICHLNCLRVLLGSDVQREALPDARPICEALGQYGLSCAGLEAGPRILQLLLDLHPELAHGFKDVTNAHPSFDRVAAFHTLADLRPSSLHGRLLDYNLIFYSQPTTCLVKCVGDIDGDTEHGRMLQRALPNRRDGFATFYQQSGCGQGDPPATITFDLVYCVRVVPPFRRACPDAVSVIVHEDTTIVRRPVDADGTPLHADAMKLWAKTQKDELDLDTQIAKEALFHAPQPPGGPPHVSTLLHHYAGFDTRDAIARVSSGCYTVVGVRVGLDFAVANELRAAAENYGRTLRSFSSLPMRIQTGLIALRVCGTPDKKFNHFLRFTPPSITAPSQLGLDPVTPTASTPLAPQILYGTLQRHADATAPPHAVPGVVDIVADRSSALGNWYPIPAAVASTAHEPPYRTAVCDLAAHRLRHPHLSPSQLLAAFPPLGLPPDGPPLTIAPSAAPLHDAVALHAALLDAAVQLALSRRVRLLCWCGSQRCHTHDLGPFCLQLLEIASRIASPAAPTAACLVLAYQQLTNADPATVSRVVHATTLLCRLPSVYLVPQIEITEPALAMRHEALHAIARLTRADERELDWCSPLLVAWQWMMPLKRGGGGQSDPPLIAAACHLASCIDTAPTLSSCDLLRPHLADPSTWPTSASRTLRDLHRSFHHLLPLVSPEPPHLAADPTKRTMRAALWNPRLSAFDISRLRHAAGRHCQHALAAAALDAEVVRILGHSLDPHVRARIQLAGLQYSGHLLLITRLYPALIVSDIGMQTYLAQRFMHRHASLPDDLRCLPQCPRLGPRVSLPADSELHHPFNRFLHLLHCRCGGWSVLRHNALMRAIANSLAATCGYKAFVKLFLHNSAFNRNQIDCLAYAWQRHSEALAMDLTVSVGMCKSFFHLAQEDPEKIFSARADEKIAHHLADCERLNRRFLPIVWLANGALGPQFTDFWDEALAFNRAADVRDRGGDGVGVANQKLFHALTWAACLARANGDMVTNMASQLTSVEPEPAALHEA